MPQSITEAHVKQWDDTIRALAQQQEARLAQHSTDRGSITGASFTMNRLAPQAGDMEEIIDRHGDTKFADATHTTRNVIMKDFFEALPVDKQDEPKVLADPNSAYMQNLVMQYNRRQDKDFYDAARGNAFDLDGNATALPTAQKIAHSSTGMTKAKIIQARKIFRGNEIDPHTGHDLFIAYNDQMLEDVLADTTLTSADFMAVKMLQEGDISGKWCGFKWIPYEALTLESSTYYTIAWSDRCLHRGRGYVEGTMGRRKDKKNLMQVDMAASHGFGRLEDEGVVEIAFQ